MKTLRFYIYPFLFLLAIWGSGCAVAQQKKEGARVETMLKNKSFVFKAQTAVPMRGSIIQLTSSYDMVVNGDSLSTYLPYFGRAHSGGGYNNQGGIQFTTTDFAYDLSDKRKKRWNIILKPHNNTDVQQLILNVSDNGYASLQVISTNRDPISFNGYVTEKI